MGDPARYEDHLKSAVAELGAAAADLTLAMASTGGRASRDAAILAEAVEAELRAVQALIQRYTARQPD